MASLFHYHLCRSQHNLNARKYSILYPHTAPLSTTESSFSFDPPPSPRSARSAEKSTTLFSFDPNVTAVASNEPYVSNKSFKSRASAENKENLRRASDIGRMVKNANKAENGSSKKERRSFKCERLSNIFSTKDSSSSSSSSGKNDTKTRKINSAPVHRKNSSISQSKFDNDDESSSNTTGTGTSSDLTMFPFDREAIDYDRIQRECFAVEEEYDNDEYVARKSFPYDYDTADDSPSYEMLEQKNPPEGIFQQYAILSQLEKDRQCKKRAQLPAASEMKTLSKIEHINKKLNETSVLIHDQPSSAVTSPIPDLKIDFFSESSSLTASAFSRSGGENEIEKLSDVLDSCQKERLTSPFSSKSNSTNSNSASINLTSNPMSTAVVTTPRVTTIVVQQVCYHILTFPFLCT
jgi:Protein of unknown function (DUF2967)